MQAVTSAVQTANNLKGKAISGPLITLMLVFFFWGFVAASNGILIPLFKAKFNLMQWQSQLVDFAFYAAYFVGSFIYFLISFFFGDPLNKIGYKNGLIIGLIISAVGALGFVPAAQNQSFFLFLLSLFTIGLGFSLQQIVANPFVIALGKPSTGAHRLSLAGGINSFGTTIGPVLLSYALFGDIKLVSTGADMSAIIYPSLGLSFAFVIFAAFLRFSNLPNISNNDDLGSEIGALKFPQLRLGMLAIFIYVGVEVTIQSNMGALLQLPSIKGLDHTKISHFISLYWGSLMIGRWTGAIQAFDFNKLTKNLLQIIMPFLAFGVIYIVNYWRGSPVDEYLYYLPFVLFAAIVFIVSGKNPGTMLVALSIAAAGFMLLGLFSSGNLALYSFIAGGLFCSVMWPCIFDLSIKGLGKYTTQGSSLLIMMILGGALIPLLQGLLVDIQGAQQSYWITVLCFAYLAWFGYKTTANWLIQNEKESI